MIAAMMTAANLGARVTGWGFVVFTIGSLAWSAIGITTGQDNLLVSNAFLTLVNLVGIWRWLGRQRSYEDGGKSAEKASRASATPDLMTATSLAGVPVGLPSGQQIGKAVEALIECNSGRISYIVVARTSESLTEELRALPRDALSFGGERIVLTLSEADFLATPVLADGNWPAMPPRRSDQRAGPAAAPGIVA